MCSYARNKGLSGIEVSFDAKPDEATRDALKAAGFRWHKVKKLWYAKETPERLQLARDLADGKECAPSGPAAPVKSGPYGVQVGDVFAMSWGYDQTNVDFFQVVKIAGKSSVRVRSVVPPRVESDPIGPDAENVTRMISRDILPPESRSVFIRDQEHGDLKRVNAPMCPDGVPYISFDVGIAMLCAPGDVTMYVSWYH